MERKPTFQSIEESHLGLLRVLKQWLRSQKDRAGLNLPRTVTLGHHAGCRHRQEIPHLLILPKSDDEIGICIKKSPAFLYILLANDAPLDVMDYYNVTPINYHTKIKMIKYCLSQGLDPNFGTRDDTLLHHVLAEFSFEDTNCEDLDEMVCLLLYYGALPTEEFQHDGEMYTAFDYVCLHMLDEVSSFVFEQLFLYTFGDGECAGKISLKAFLRVVGTEKYLRKYRKCNRKRRIIDELKNLDLEFTIGEDEMRYEILEIFVDMDFVCCMDMVKRCPDALRAVLEESEVYFFEKIYEFTKIMDWVVSQENVFNSAVDFFENISNEELYETVEDAGEQDAMKFIFFILQYGFKCPTDLRDFVYQKFGDCQLFRTLLHVDTSHSVYNPSEPYNNNRRKMFSVIVADFSLTVHNIAETISCSSWTLYGTVLKTEYGYLTPTDANKLLDFFVHPKLVQSFLDTPDLPKRVFNKIQCLPKVPLLQELARDAFKVHLVRSFDVKTTKDFYTLVGSLPVGIGFKKMISLEQTLYNVISPEDARSGNKDYYNIF
ncbi:uncharacterized protein LOC135138982 [Zophobas morio]|uniref:uncharacterized protein LOC135138982 n=1 Tax=Zophobas morio TaxID=2755281 RepID=UPI0030834AB6